MTNNVTVFKNNRQEVLNSITDVESAIYNLKQHPVFKQLEALEQLLTVHKNELTNLENGILEFMTSYNLTKLEGEGFSLNIRQSESIELLDLDKVPQEFVKVTTKEIKSLDKIAVKKWIKECGEIPAGTELVVTKRLEVK